MYGKRKPIALRRPLSVSECKKSCAKKVDDFSPLLSLVEDDADQLSTPTVTEGESATDTELDTECEGDTTPKDKKRELDSLFPTQRATSQHDLHNKYFRRDVVGLHNIDLLRQVPEFVSRHLS
jgi:phosphatidylethanolamine N-methyltransferase